MEEARAATEADLPRLAELAREAIAEMAPMRGGAVWRAREARQEPLERDLGTLLGRDDSRLLVGTYADVPLAYAVAHVEQLADGSCLGVIDDIYVDPGAREVGLGGALMDDLVAWCEARGCFGMDAMALPGDRSTKNFFEEAGFTARKLVMHHSLRKADDPGTA